MADGSVDAHLIESPAVFQFADDWSKADYLAYAAGVVMSVCKRRTRRRAKTTIMGAPGPLDPGVRDRRRRTEAVGPFEPLQHVQPVVEDFFKGAFPIYGAILPTYFLHIYIS